MQALRAEIDTTRSELSAVKRAVGRLAREALRKGTTEAYHDALTVLSLSGELSQRLEMR